MNKSVAPGQLNLGAEVTREEMLLQKLHPNINPESPQSIVQIERENHQVNTETAALQVADSIASANKSAAEQNDFLQDRPNQLAILAPAQDQTFGFIDDDGSLVVGQKCWPDEDQTIRVNRELIPVFMDQLCDLLGIASFGGIGK